MSLLHFEQFTLDTDRGVLLVAGREVELRPKSLDLLQFLAQNRERLLTKSEIMQALWRNVFVSDDSLKQCISEVRGAIGDHDRQLIRTLPRRGYLFAATISSPAAAPRLETTSSEVDKPTIAVLPFLNIGRKEHDYFSDGIAEDAITELSRFSELFVIARNSSFKYRGSSVDLRSVGHDLGVRYILEGSVRRQKSRVRITAQLVDAESGTHRWADRYDRDKKDVFAIQEEVARTIAAVLVAHVNKAETQRPLLKPPAQWRAYDYYMRAADTWIQFISSWRIDRLEGVRTLLEKALYADPNYARAYMLLACTHRTAWLNPVNDEYLSVDSFERAIQMSRKALELDQNLPEAYAELAYLIVRRGEFDAAVAAVDRAIALNPNLADHRFAPVLVWAGDSARAVEIGTRHMRQDPFYLHFAPKWVGCAHFFLENYQDAKRWFRECIARAPYDHWCHTWLAATYAHLGQLDEARKAVAEVLRLNPRYRIGIQIGVTSAYKRRQDVENILEGLRKAGLPE